MKNCNLNLIKFKISFMMKKNWQNYMKNLRDTTGVADDKMFLNLYNIVRRIIDHKKNFSEYNIFIINYSLIK